ncbi:aspartyl protease family protein At5g10770-like [Phragmites australis]|uniref:aspartyl protease family protein At5g10770-like n=1 Tax=Phragmites australis TaxID=29695 RepID=UPI002D783615|nr:aspartyl protease family protein At5g10770-like [Phragmites australis]
MASVSKLLLLLLCSYCHSLVTHAEDDPNYKVFSIGSVVPEANCSETKAIPSPGGATVPLHHRYGPCSPMPSKEIPTLEEVLRSDQLRASYIQRKFTASQQTDATVPTTLGTSLDTLEYVITVGIGSPAVTQNVFIDTGSDVSWVQCKPCSQCHSQVDPLFDPSKSSTYSPFSCGSAACVQLGREGNGNGCLSSRCQYIVKYLDGTSTTGTYSSDTLTLGSIVVKSFQFGCSHATSGMTEKTAGMMGLGGGAQSLVSQTAGALGKAFSYCLPPTSASSGFLTLGASSGRSGFVTTRIFRNSKVPTFYLVLLEAIRVGGKQLNVPPSFFSAGSVMDSGTILTYLPPTAYSALSSAFKAGMKQYPKAQPQGILDTCFDFSGLSSVTIPAVSLVFGGGAVVNLDANGIMLGNCLAFAANDDDSSLGIIGNVQQRTFEVLYDVGRNAVGFRARAC